MIQQRRHVLAFHAAQAGARPDDAGWSAHRARIVCRDSFAGRGIAVAQDPT
jgi:hypothetical protein